MNRPRFFLMLITAAVAAATIAPGAASAAKGCAPGKVVWVVAGKAKCLKTAPINAAKGASAEPEQVAAWIRGLAKPAPGSKFRLPKGFNRALPVAARSAKKLLKKAMTTPFKPDSKKPKQAKKAGIAASPVTDTMTLSSPTIEASGGISIKAVATLNRHANNSIDAEMKYEITKGKDTVVLTPEYGELGKGIPPVDCPTADGVLKITDSDSFGTTAVRKRGNRVLQAVTERSTRVIRATGHVGRDARLHSVDAQVTVKTEHYERGMQLVVNFTGNLEISREGKATLNGPMTASPKIKAAGASSKDEKAWGERAAAHFAANSETISTMGSAIDLARWRMLQDEYKWYQLPNYCARITTNPDSAARVNEGQSKSVDAVIEADDGGESPGRVHGAVCRAGQLHGDQSRV